ncbi:helix-turn-helix domain-containing protein [Agromyces sp. LHK192]|uniref:helix-turn-helix domain-containing protein n=1 Tax=Agromyces sp. LHK192 TaxID=2498704 RepID=UPI000FDA0EE7|nr:helix-turn-helix domain-containing protein [Agromyces sp. LHK192]
MIDEAVHALGAAIRHARKASNLTQRDLAELAETSERTVRDIERGTGSASIGTVARVAATVGLTLEVRR